MITDYKGYSIETITDRGDIFHQVGTKLFHSFNRATQYVDDLMETTERQQG